MAIFNEVNDTKLTLDTLELGASTQVDIVLPSLKRFQDLADATDELKKSVAQNVDGIARVEQQKQDRLPQVDLDNIASIDRMKDDIKGKASTTYVNTELGKKQDKLTDKQIQAIGEIDSIKAIALQNQTDVANVLKPTSLAKGSFINQTVTLSQSMSNFDFIYIKYALDGFGVKYRTSIVSVKDLQTNVVFMPEWFATGSSFDNIVRFSMQRVSDTQIAFTDCNGLKILEISGV